MVTMKTFTNNFILLQCNGFKKLSWFIACFALLTHIESTELKVALENIIKKEINSTNL
jgi:hypothetical protein